MCVNTFPFFVLGGVFCSFPSLSPRFVLNRSGTTTKKGKTRKRRKKKTDQLAILQSFVHLTGTGLPPATSPLRGEVGGRGGRKRGDFASHQIRFKKQNGEKKSTFGPFSFFFTVLKWSQVLLLLYYYIIIIVATVWNPFLKKSKGKKQKET